MASEITTSVAAGPEKTPAIAASACFSSIQEELQNLRATSGRIFLELGRILHSIAARGRDVATMSRTMTELASSQETVHTIGTLEKVLEDANRVQILGNLSRSRLKQASSVFAKCAPSFERLNKLPPRLNTVGILARIEASRLDDTNINVSGLTANVDSMAADIATHVATVATEAETLRQLITSGKNNLEASAKSDRGAGQDVVQQIQKIVDSFRARRAISARGAQNVNEEFVAMQHETDRIVMSLQSEDIARQRIEHIAEALQHVEIGDSKDLNVAVLQRSQLKSVRDLISESFDTIRRSLQSLGPKIDALNAQTAELASQSGEDGTSFTDFVNQRLGTLSQVISRHFCSAQIVISTIRSVLPSLTEMMKAVNCVEDLQASIRLMALNAEIKTAHLGEDGAAMGVLAAELHRVTAESDQDGTLVLETMHEMQALIGDLAKHEAVSAAPVFQSCDCGAVQSEIKTLVLEVEREGRRLPELLHQLSAKTTELRQHLAKALSAAEEGDLLGAKFDDVLGKLDAELERLGYVGGAILEQDHRVSELSHRYSMHSERRVHEEVFGTVMRPPESSLTIGEPASAEFGENVELF